MATPGGLRVGWPCTRTGVGKLQSPGQIKLASFFFKSIFCIFLTNFVNIWPCVGLKSRVFDCRIRTQSTGLSNWLCYTNDPLIINLFNYTQQWGGKYKKKTLMAVTLNKNMRIDHLRWAYVINSFIKKFESGTRVRLSGPPGSNECPPLH